VVVVIAAPVVVDGGVLIDEQKMGKTVPATKEPMFKQILFCKGIHAPDEQLETT